MATTVPTPGDLAKLEKRLQANIDALEAKIEATAARVGDGQVVDGGAPA